MINNAEENNIVEFDSSVLLDKLASVFKYLVVVCSKFIIKWTVVSSARNTGIANTRVCVLLIRSPGNEMG